MAGVKDYKQEVMAHVCHPLAERLRAWGYLFEEEVKTDAQTPEDMVVLDQEGS